MQPKILGRMKDMASTFEDSAGNTHAMMAAGENITSYAQEILSVVTRRQWEKERASTHLNQVNIKLKDGLTAHDIKLIKLADDPGTVNVETEYEINYRQAGRYDATTNELIIDMRGDGPGAYRIDYKLNETRLNKDEYNPVEDVVFYVDNQPSSLRMHAPELLEAQLIPGNDIDANLCDVIPKPTKSASDGVETVSLQNGKDTLYIDQKDKVFTYDLTVELPDDESRVASDGNIRLSEYESFRIYDALVAELSLEGAQVLVGDQEASHLAKFLKIDKTKGTVDFHIDNKGLRASEKFDFKTLNARTITVRITAKIKPDAKLSHYVDSRVPNTAQLTVNGKTTNTNTVHVVPPIRVEVTKRWTGDNIPKQKPDVYFQLMKKVGNGSATAEGAAKKLTYASDGQPQVVAWDNLPTKNGQDLITYTVKEVKADGSDWTAPNYTPGQVTGANGIYHVANNYTEPPATEPDIKKTVSYQGNSRTGTPKDSDEDALVVHRRNPYEYKIEVEIPEDIKDYDKFIITDKLDDRLHFANKNDAYKSVSIDNDNFEIKIEGKTVTASVKKGQFAKLNGVRKVTLTIKAQIDNLETIETIPNTATVTYANTPGTDKNKTTKPVNVVPPAVEKTVQNIDFTDRRTRTEALKVALGEEYRYSVRALVPKNVTSIQMEDRLEAPLQLSEAYVTVDGEEDEALTKAVKVNGQQILLETKGILDNVAGKEIELHIIAKIRPDADISGYLNYEVPNTAKFRLNNTGDWQPTNTVNVTPPHLVKSVAYLDGSGRRSDAQPLEISRKKDYRYNVDVVVPADMKANGSLSLRDKLEDVLKVGKAQILVNGQVNEALTKLVKVQGQTVTVDIKEGLDKMRGQVISLDIVAQIRQDANLAPYAEGIVPNTAELKFNNDGKWVPSNTVNVIPPFIEKSVSELDGSNERSTEEALMVAKGKDYKYTIRGFVADNFRDYIKTSIRIFDKLEPVLEVKDAKVTVAGKVDQDLTDKIKIDETTNTVSIEVTDNFEKYMNVEIALEITANVRPEANLASYVNNIIPNTAHVEFNNDGQFIPSNTVNVDPPFVTKSVSKQDTDNNTRNLTDKPGYRTTEEALTVARNEIYTYYLSGTVPKDIKGYTSILVEDVLEPVLEPLKIQVFVDGQRASQFDRMVKIDGQRVYVDINQNLDYLAGRKIDLEISAKIRPDADLAPYLDNTIPNTARVQINNSGKWNPTNTVKVTPPPLQKSVSQIDGYTDLRTSEDPMSVVRGKDYKYQITTQVPNDVKDYTSIKIEDILEDVLEVQSARVMVGGFHHEILSGKDNLTYSKDSQKVALDIKQGFTALAGKTIVLEITARIRPEADLSKYENSVVPNTAKVNFNNEGWTDSNRVNVVPPPSIKKSVTDGVDTRTATVENSQLKPIVIAKGKIYTYTVETEVPVDIEDYTKFVISDELDTRLDFATADPVASVTMDSDAFEIKVIGSKVIATLKDGQFASLSGKKKVTMTIKAKIGADAQAGDINDKDTWVPNTATIEYKHVASAAGEKTTKPVNVTPPPTNPDVKKTVNAGKDKTATATVDKAGDKVIEVERDKRYTYEIDVDIPSDIKDYKEFVITDTLDPRLAFFYDSQDNQTLEDAASINHPAFEVKVDEATQQVTAAVKEEHFATLTGVKTVKLKIQAKIKGDVPTGDQIDNRAKVDYVNSVNTKGEKETKPVTVTPPPKEDVPPTVDKKINSNLTNLEIDVDKAYTYNITSKLPADIEKYENFVITDKVDSRLDVAKAEILGAAAKAFDVQVTPSANGTVVTATVKDFAALKGMANLELVISASIKKSVKAGTVIPNTAEIDFTNESGQTGHKPTKPVTVTPPPTTPTIEKSVVNGQDSATATEDKAGDKVLTIDRAKTYEYKVKVALPTDIASYKSFVITDTLDKDLTFATDKDGNVLPVAQVLTIEGADAALFDFKLDGQTATATVKKDQFAKLADVKEVTLTIKAQIKPNVAAGQQIDNTAKVDYVNKVDSKGEKETKPVTVTPPPKEDVPPTVDKKINGNQTDLEIDVDKAYTYNITSKLPADIEKYENFIITDKVDNRLDVAKAEILGAAAKAFDVQVTPSANGTVVTATVKDFAALKGMTNLELVISASIKKSVKAGTVIPNTAEIDFTNESGQTGHKPTKPVTVTPPPSQPDVNKVINDGLTHLDIEHEKTYTYHIKSVLPSDIENYESYVLTDKVDARLTVKDVTMLAPEGAFTLSTSQDKDGNTVIIATADPAKLAGIAEVEMQINAQIKAGVTGEKIPNKADLDFINSQGQTGHKPTPPVTVTPPPPSQPEVPGITKRVNGQTKLDLRAIGDVFTYTIDTQMPRGVKTFEILDTLESVLVFNGDVTVTANGKAVQPAIRVEGQNLLVAFTEAQTKAYAGQLLQVTFKANIRSGADLTPYLDKASQTTPVPNVAALTLNNDPSTKQTTEPVYVVPPKPEAPTPGQPTKTVEDVDGKKASLQKLLESPDSKFRFNVAAELLEGANLSYFAMEDQLEPVFVITDDKVDLAVVAGQKATYAAPAAVALEKAQAKLKDLLVATDRASTSADKAELEAKLAALSQEKADLIAAYEKALKAYQDKAPVAPSQDLVALDKAVQDLMAQLAAAPVTAQAELEKDLAAAQAELTQAQADLAAYDKAVKAYQADAPVLSTEELDKTLADLEAQLKALPDVAADKQAMTDLEKEIKEIFEPAAKAEAALYQAIKDEQIMAYLIEQKLATLTIKDNLVVFEITDKATLQSLEGLKLQLLIYAHIKPNADLTAYTKGTWVEVPNTARVHFGDQAKVTNRVTVVPPTEDPVPPTPEEPEKPTVPPTEDPKSPTPPSQVPPKEMPPTLNRYNYTPSVKTTGTYTPPATSSLTPTRANSSLPATGSQSTGYWIWVLASFMLGSAGLLFFKMRRQES